MKRSSKVSIAAAAGVFSAVSGALAVYLTKHPKLRKELTKSDSASEALKTFGEHVQRDGSRFIRHLQDFLHRHKAGDVEETMEHVKKASRHAERKAVGAARKAQESIEQAAERGTEAMERLTDRA